MMSIKIKKQVEGTQFIKKIVAVVLMLLFYIQIWGSNGPGFVEGTQLYVMANSGLTLRLEPNKTSESLGIVEFGSSVQVLNQPDTVEHIEKINWVEGRWIFVEVDGVTGYMFDGFLSDLPMPVYEFEKCQLDLDLIYPLESWADINLGERESTSLEAGALKKVTDKFEGGDKMTRSQKNGEFKIEVLLTDVRLMDAYHLLQSMIDSRSRLETFRAQTTYINGKDGKLKKVKIELDNPVELKKMENGDVKISIKSDNYICGL